MLPLYFTKATVGCKCKPHGEKIEFFSPCCLAPQASCPGPAPGWPWCGDHQGPLSGHITRVWVARTHHKLPFIRENNLAITDRLHPADSDQWTQDSVIKVASSRAMRSNESRQRTCAEQQRAGQGERGVSHSTGFLNLFFWFYVDWTKREAWFLSSRDRSLLFLLSWICTVMVNDRWSKSKLSMSICWTKL